MEFKIKLLAKWMAIAAGILCLMLTVDELMPVKTIEEFVQRKFENRTEEGKNLFIDYYLITGTGIEIRVPVETYSVLNSKDNLQLFYTPVFHQLKAFDGIKSGSGELIHAGDPSKPREVPFIAGMVAMALALLSAFVIQRFELKVALAFLALVITAVRWWFIGV